jgi:hypothetical protein
MYSSLLQSSKSESTIFSNNQLLLKAFESLLSTFLNKYKLVASCCLIQKLFYISWDSKTRSYHCFFLKNWASLFTYALLFFLLNNTKKELYPNVPEMFYSNLKTSIQKYPIFCSRYNFSSANVSDFYTHFIAKN